MVGMSRLQLFQNQNFLTLKNSPLEIVLNNKSLLQTTIKINYRLKFSLKPAHDQISVINLHQK